MAELTDAGHGWLGSGHVLWLLNKAKSQQNTVLCICEATTGPKSFLNYFNRNQHSGMFDNLSHLVFVVCVGMRGDGKTYIGLQEGASRGNHWVTVTVDLTPNPRVLYGDTKGWPTPPDLLTKLAQYTRVFGIETLPTQGLTLLACPEGHVCSPQLCINYPKQTCSQICGVAATIIAVIAALDMKCFLDMFTGPWTRLTRTHLHEPTKYAQYLRRVLICWFMEGRLDMSLLWPNSHRSSNCMGHSHINSKQPSVRQAQTTQNKYRTHSTTGADTTK